MQVDSTPRSRPVGRILTVHTSYNNLSCAGGRHNMPPPPANWPFDLESGVRVTCDVAYLCANFSLPRPLCSRLRPDVRDRQTDRQTSDVRRSSSRNAPYRKGGGITSQPNLTLDWDSKAKGKGTYTWYSASSWSSPQKRSGMARVLKRFRSFTCTPHTFPIRNRNEPSTCLCLPSCSWYSFTDPEGMEGWVGLCGCLRGETVMLPGGSHPSHY